MIPDRIVRRDLAGFAVTFNEPIHGLVYKECHFPEIVNERDQQVDIPSYPAVNGRKKVICSWTSAATLRTAGSRPVPWIST